jgi:hypothetical protein
MTPFLGGIPSELPLSIPGPVTIVKAVPSIMPNLIMQNWFQNPLTLVWNAPYCSSCTHAQHVTENITVLAVGLFVLL